MAMSFKKFAATKNEKLTLKKRKSGMFSFKLFEFAVSIGPDMWPCHRLCIQGLGTHCRHSHTDCVAKTG